MAKRRDEVRGPAFVEWLGANVILRSEAMSAGDDSPVEALLWMDQAGRILEATPLTTGWNVEDVSRSLTKAALAANEMMSAPPTHIRVASRALADAVRASKIMRGEIVCAPTPEVDAAVASLVDFLTAQNDAREEMRRYSRPGLTKDAVAAFFAAAARLHRARPWSFVPTDHTLFSVRCTALGLADAILIVIGQLGESLGFLLFRTSRDWVRYEACSEDPDAPIPPHLSVSFDRLADLPPSTREEPVAHGWELAGDDAYPFTMVHDDRGIARAPNARELDELTALASALASLADDRDARTRLSAGVGLDWRTRVASTVGMAEMTFHVEPDIHPRDDELDEEARAEDLELVESFMASPHAQRAPSAPQWTQLLVDYVHAFERVSLVDIHPAILEDFLFEHIPAKVSCEASAASDIIREYRALFDFLLTLEPADEFADCRALLDDEATALLRQRMSDPAAFGMAKSFVMGAMGSPPRAAQTSRAVDRARREKAKKAKKARKKNRR